MAVPDIRDARFTLPAVTADIRSPLLRRLLADWVTACPAADIPDTVFIDPFRLRYVLDALIVVDIVPQPDGSPRFRYRLIGSDIVDRRGRDQTGRWMDENPDPGLVKLATAASHAVLAARQPALLHFSRSLFDRFYPVEALVLPLGPPGLPPVRLLAAQIYPKDTPRRRYGDAG